MNIIKKKNLLVRCFDKSDFQRVNVTLGDIDFAFKFNYQVLRDGKNFTGSAMGRVLADHLSYFIKRVLIIDGLLEWDP